MSKRVFSKLSDKDIEALKEVSAPQVYKKPFHVVYTGQTPNFSFYLFSGKVRLFNRDQEIIIDEPGLFCAENLHTKISSPFNIEIQTDSLVSTLDRQQLEVFQAS